MPTFNRPPEWQQQADRHSDLVDPVLTVRQLSRFELSLKHLVRIDHALVFSTPKGGYETYLPPRRPTRSEIAAKRYSAVYEVDMGVHPHSAELTLPSDNDAFEFTAVLDLSWQVLDPGRFVESGHRNVPATLIGELQQAARPVSRRFAIADSAAAERELLQAVTVLGPLGAPAGLQVTWTLRLRRDQANIEHQQRLQAIDYSAAEQVRVAQRGMEVDVEADRRFRQQDALQIDRAAAYGGRQQELALQQQRWQHEQALLHSGQQHQLALQQGRQQIELQKLGEEKIAFYQWHLQQGGVHAWALHLAQRPEDSHLVMSSMREDQLRMIQAQMDLVKQLLSGDTAEGYELEGPKQLALRTVSDILNQRLPGVPQTPPLLPSAAGPAYPDPDPPLPGYAPSGPGRAEPPVPAGPPLQDPPAQAPGLDGHLAPTRTPTPAPTPTSAPAPAPGAGPAAAQPYGPYGGQTGPATGQYTGAQPGPAGSPYGAPGGPTWQAPQPYAPPPPLLPPLVPPASYPGVPAPSAGPVAPEAAAWQPPPGYGSTPTLPAQDVAAVAHPADGTPRPGRPGPDGPGPAEPRTAEQMPGGPRSDGSGPAEPDAGAREDGA
ncbi:MULTISPECIES: hypothetical protein [unclassified Streptomyces]|uniref:hypothetical protein n=1 Tax=unclassified Streptomyces TaxID=2593676 RepID=UPI002E33F03E|nr:hypothetical protein [Streptomyces sp. NBC_01455]